jgi:hypothetical protein
VVTRRRGGERGAVLLVVVMLTAAGTAMSAALVARASLAAAEVRARRDVLCARYAALGGLALGAPSADASSLLGERVDALAVSLIRRGPAWGILRAAAACGTAKRPLEPTMDDPAACDLAPPPAT